MTKASSIKGILFAINTKTYQLLNHCVGMFIIYVINRVFFKKDPPMMLNEFFLILVT